MGEPIISVWIPGDQLLADHPALRAAQAATSRENVRVVLVESAARLRKLPYQRKKLVLLLSAMRHYAAELRAQGYHVEYVQAASALDGLTRHTAAHGAAHLFTMAVSEYAGRQFQQARLGPALGIPVTVVPNEQMLVEQYNPVSPAPAGARGQKRVVMETFYRAMRRHFDVLMDADGEPVGGQWNFDKENRKPLPKRGLSIPAPRTFTPDAVTREVMDQVAAMEGLVGTVAGFELAVTRDQARQAFEDFVAHRLPDFGPYEDAMSRRHAVLFHSTLSPYMNIGLLDPLAMVRRAEQAYADGHAPINSVEGFVRQILGWREFIYWQYWRQMPDMLTANAWDHHRPMPSLFWTGATEMACLHHAVSRVIESGYGHHIERLMLICNFCMLAGINPAAVNRWFLSVYVDAYEWVVTPNVIGMGLNADGGITATKPYIASANYINKMSDFCGQCRYDHTQRHGDDACPFNVLYWNFLLQNEATLRSNPRFGPAVLGLKHLDDDERTQVARQAALWLDALEYDTDAA